jgi:hypothetical protein
LSQQLKSAPYVAGNSFDNTWKVICDICGRQRISYQLRKTWEGWMSCADCWEPRQPQDLVRVYPEHPAPDYSRPRPNPPRHLLNPPFNPYTQNP